MEKKFPKRYTDNNALGGKDSNGKTKFRSFEFFKYSSKSSVFLGQFDRIKKGNH
jgi:hypothetical protein